VLKSVKSLVSLVQSFHQLFSGTDDLVSGMLQNQPQIAPLADVTPLDASQATAFGGTEGALLTAANHEVDGSITVDGPIAGGRINLDGLQVTGSGAGGAGSAGGIHLGGAGSPNGGSTTAAAGMMGGAAMTAARAGGVATSGAGSTPMMAGRGMVSGAGGAAGMGERSSKRGGKRLTVQIVPESPASDD
jgi:hypothetical protein